MKAIITGGTGFLGSHLVKALTALNWQVIVLARNVSHIAHTSSTNLEYRSVDIADSKSLDVVFENADVVFHCAALSSVWGKYTDFYSVNVQGTKNIITCCEKYNIKKLVYVSSTSVYFEYKNEVNISENHPVARCFANDYAKTKYLGEQVVLKAKNKVNVVVVRPRGIVGDGDESIMPRLLRVAKNGYFPLLNNGEAIVDVTYVKNVVKALILCATVDNLNGEIFNISNDQPMRVKDLLNLALKNKKVKYIKLPYKLIFAAAWLLEKNAKLMNKGEPRLTMYGVGLLAHTQVLNIDKAKRRLGYKPSYSIEDAVDNYLKWEADRA